MKELLLRYDKDVEAWREVKEPYITIEVETEEDFNFIQDAIAKQTAEKPLEVAEQEDEDCYCLAFICPSCEQSVFGQPYRPNHCKHCGQKLEWREE